MEEFRSNFPSLHLSPSAPSKPPSRSEHMLRQACARHPFCHPVQVAIGQNFVATRFAQFFEQRRNSRYQRYYSAFRGVFGLPAAIYVGAVPMQPPQTRVFQAITAAKHQCSVNRAELCHQHVAPPVHNLLIRKFCQKQLPAPLRDAERVGKARTLVHFCHTVLVGAHLAVPVHSLTSTSHLPVNVRNPGCIPFKCL